ncbi:hypothetical protein [Ensifer sp. ZNC0028]|uniref:hypothetical protein n=1 Tax=Ensifer sp. ZNC0028 TaxID=1339236 RepID=UPI0005B9488D|nr:hypothetical protein [Ensifer sp. ZNC0028]
MGGNAHRNALIELLAKAPLAFPAVSPVTQKSVLRDFYRITGAINAPVSMIAFPSIAVLDWVRIAWRVRFLGERTSGAKPQGANKQNEAWGF